jgi:hypothetical protein
MQAQHNIAVVDSNNYKVLHIDNDTLKIEIRYLNKWEVWLYQKNEYEKKAYYLQGDPNFHMQYLETQTKMSDSILVKIPRKKLKKNINIILGLRDSLNNLEMQKYTPNCDRGIVNALDKDAMYTVFYFHNKNDTEDFHIYAALRLYVYYCDNRYGKNFTSLANIFYEMCKLPKVVPYELSGFPPYLFPK